MCFWAQSFYILRFIPALPKILLSTHHPLINLFLFKIPKVVSISLFQFSNCCITNHPKCSGLKQQQIIYFADKSVIWAGICRESLSLCHTLEAGGAVLKAGQLAAKRAHAYRGQTGSGSQLTCLLPVHVGLSSQLGGWVPRAVCVCVCGMCVGTIIFITYFQTSSIISATL